jgi:hypothetical protein
VGELAVTPLELPIAVRAYTEQVSTGSDKESSSWDPVTAWSRYFLFLDTETTTDFTQRLLFGSYQFCEGDEDQGQLVCKEEGLFHADDLEKIYPVGYECLREYARNHKANVGAGVPGRLKVMSRTEFVENIFWRIAYQARALVVAFNLPFDLSRLALDCGEARGSSWGGFSFVLWGRWDPEKECVKPHPDRSRIVIEHVNSRMAFIHFGRPRKTDPQDQRPADGIPPDPHYSYQGRFLDLKTLVSAVTGDPHSLDSAGEAFGVAHPKTQIAEHGVITPEYIDYNRRDVLASRELLERLREEFDCHPIDLDPCDAYSSASIVKAYFRAMGLRRPSGQFRGIPLEVIGQTMTTFFGGRTEARIRKTIVPVVSTDFLSMYPTIQSLMELCGSGRLKRDPAAS